jgi:hypothetical protein
MRSRMALQEHLMEKKQSLAENQVRLRTLQCLEILEVSLKGEVKQRERSPGTK